MLIHRKFNKKNSDIILEKEAILDRYAEYIIELFEDPRKDSSVMKVQIFWFPLLGKIRSK